MSDILTQKKAGKTYLVKGKDVLVLVEYSGTFPIVVDNITKIISVDLSNYANKNQILVFKENVTFDKDINARTGTFLKAFSPENVVEGSLGITLINNKSLNARLLLIKTAIELAKNQAVSLAVEQTLNPNLLVEGVDYEKVISDKLCTITFTKPVSDYELMTIETFGTNAKNVNGQVIFKPNNRHYEYFILNYKSTKTYYGIAVEWLPTNANVMTFRTTDNIGWSNQSIELYGRLK